MYFCVETEWNGYELNCNRKLLIKVAARSLVIYIITVLLQILECNFYSIIFQSFEDYTQVQRVIFSILQSFLHIALLWFDVVRGIMSGELGELLDFLPNIDQEP